MVLFVLLAMAYGVALSVSALLMDDTRSMHSQSIGDIAWLLLCTVIENFGYRQMVAVWRFAAMVGSAGRTRVALGPAGAQGLPGRSRAVPGGPAGRRA